MAKKNEKMKPYSTMHLLGVLAREGGKSLVKTGLAARAAEALTTKKRKKEYDAGVR